VQGLLDTKEKIIESMRDENRRNANMLVAAAETRKVEKPVFYLLG